ncbi:hypothetical protein BO70DRAFT_184454 [Aspergillus heteromorphus CBS 117.55]|uniref:2OG-Fe dioxygenase family protein n=1 Tax=Aspergillus heteromorphus CBS 117.55 TaxID=1448321 RepID=A0A317WQ63_9EURO|nr:uncharacterized protein BO70DRAFT_184454 [Aspergillus heteromorphus CBS 117.55]PWY88536.1 hypothetical protein BO70DRAFT_184454 [Aspergillus heteromorphus CBS 117.55]
MGISSKDLKKSIYPSAHTLNVLDRRYDVQFYEAITKIMALRQTYLRDHYIFVRGEDMVPILRGLGAREEDFEFLKFISDQTGDDPTVDYRTLTYGRYCIDFETRSIRRLERQPFTLTVQEDYKRHDSGIPRDFDEAPADMQGNTVVQALMLFKALVFQNVPVVPRDMLDYASHSWICMMFNVRTFTEEKLGILGEPALEGVHSDGADHTMTVLIGSNNVRSDSAVTYMHENRETTGIPVWETNPTLIKARVQHRDFLDTLVFVDHDYKHSLTPIYQIDRSQRATRDMLVVHTRRPKVKGHISGYSDTMTLHQTASIHIPMWLP